MLSSMTAVGRRWYVGLSTDTLPTIASVVPGTLLYFFDTHEWRVLDGAGVWQPYSEASINPVRKTAGLADAGRYFTANNAQTGIAANTNTAFTATAPYLLIENNAAAGTNKRIYLDYVSLLTTAAGVGTASAVVYTAAALVIDNKLRYTSGGTQLTANSTNMNVTSTSSALVYAGVILANAASASVVQVSGIRNLRLGVSTTVPDEVGDTKYLNFGGVESPGQVAGSAANVMANGMFLTQNFPSVVIGPQQSALLYIWYVGITSVTAASYAPEVGWWER